MKSTSPANLLKQLSVIALAGVLMATSGILAESAQAGGTTSTPMPSTMAGMTMSGPTSKPTPKPSTKSATKKSSVNKGNATPKATPKATPANVAYTLNLGTSYSKTKVALSLGITSGKRTNTSVIGSFTASISGVVNFSYKGSIAKNSVLYVSANGKSKRAITGAAIQLLAAPVHAAPFVEPTPTPTLIPVPLPTTAATPSPSATPNPSSSPSTPATAASVAPVPALGSFFPTYDGYVVQVANFDSSFIWTAVDSQGGLVSISSSGQITVTKLGAGTTSTLNVTASRKGFVASTTSSATVTVLSASAVAATPPTTPAPAATPPVIYVGGVVYVYAPNISLTISNVVLNQLDPFPTYAIQNTGGTATSYSISPAAPPGTSFDTATGILSGTVTQGLSQTTFTITASNLSGRAYATFALTVNAGSTQKISFLQPYTMRVGDADQILYASSDSGLSPILTVLPVSQSVCSIVPVLGTYTVHVTGAGVCIIDATQPGAGSVLPALKVEKSFPVLPASSSSFLLVLDPNGGYFSNGSTFPSSLVVTAGTVVTLPTLSNNAFANYAWTVGDISGTVVTGSTVTITSDLVLVAKWS